MPGKTWTLKVARGIKRQYVAQNQQHTMAGAVVAGWGSARGTGESSDTWNWEKGEAVTGNDRDRLWTGQVVGLCGKPGAH